MNAGQVGVLITNNVDPIYSSNKGEAFKAALSKVNAVVAVADKKNEIYKAAKAVIPVANWMESWGEFRDRNPDGLVMDEPEWRRAYGQNPYVGYDTSTRPFLYQGENPPHGINPLARVVRVEDRAWTFERLREAGEIREVGLVLSWTPGQASALDSRSIAEGRDVGTVRVRDEAGRDVPHDIPFAFAFHAFHPDGTWMLGD